jgi:DNA-binding NarL/FixJ family response regulator
MRCGLVILADPHPITLAGVRQLLESEGESVVMVAEGGALLQAVEKLRPDLVIADLTLPASKSQNIVRLLKQHHPDIRLIIMSMDDEWTVLNEVMEAGAEGFLLKRRIALDLLPAITAVCQGHRYVSPDVDQRERWCTESTASSKKQPEAGGRDFFKERQESQK